MSNKAILLNWILGAAFIGSIFAGGGFSDSSKFEFSRSVFYTVRQLFFVFIVVVGWLSLFGASIQWLSARTPFWSTAGTFAKLIALKLLVLVCVLGGAITAHQLVGLAFGPWTSGWLSASIGAMIGAFLGFGCGFLIVRLRQRRGQT